MSFAFPEEVGPGLPSARRSVSGLLRRRSRTVPATVEFREASESSRHSRQRVHETHDNKSVFPTNVRWPPICRLGLSARAALADHHKRRPDGGVPGRNPVRRPRGVGHHSKHGAASCEAAASESRAITVTFIACWPQTSQPKPWRTRISAATACDTHAFSSTASTSQRQSRGHSCCAQRTQGWTLCGAITSP